MKFDTFTSLKEISRASIKIKHSIFIATASFVESEDAAKAFISKISFEFKDATHNCWAYKIGETEYSSDAGEPSGSAGKPILFSIKSSGMDRVAVVVTRYFGGTKLGIRGLIEAYSGAANMALKGKQEKFLIGKKIKVETDYHNFDKLAYRFRKAGYFYYSPPEFTEKVTLHLFVPLNEKLDFPNDFLQKAEIPQSALLKI